MKRVLLILALGVFIVSCASSDDGAAVRVVRAAYNQPSLKVQHALTPHEADLRLFEQQGYTAAEDRFLQMDLMRRQGSGTLSEVFGKDSLAKDIEIRGTGLPFAAQKSLERISNENPEIIEALEAYASGVNRFLNILPRRHPNWMRLYRQYTNDPQYSPKPWAPIDSIVIAEAVSFHLSSNVMQKVTLGLLGISATEFAQLPEMGDLSQFTQLWDLRPIERQFIVGNFRPQPRDVGVSTDSVSQTARDFSQSVANFKKTRNPGLLEWGCEDRGFPFPPCNQRDLIGSNNWVVSPEFTGSGAGILANDPHLAITFPTVFYEMALDSKSAGGTLYVRGLSVAGVPGVLIGHNDQIAWGMTNLGADVDDLYLEHLNKDRTATLFNGEWVKIEEEVSIIQVRQSDGSLKPHEFRYRSVPHHGPLLSEYNSVLQKGMKWIETIAEKNLALSYRWVGHKGTKEIVAMLQLDRAQNYEQFVAALKNFEVGAQNIVYGDRKGNIAYRANGLFPRREYLSVRMPPYVPVPGTGRYEWSGYRTDTEVPQLYNPEQGRIVTANNDPFGHSDNRFLSDFKDYFGAGFSTGCRAARIAELLDSKKGSLTVQDVQRIQFDHLDLSARRFVGLLRAHISKLQLTNEAKAFAERLLAWDFVADRKKEEPLLFNLWMEAIADDYLRPFAGFQQIIPGYNTMIRPFKISTLTIKSAFHRLQTALDNGDAEAGVQSMATSLHVAATKLVNDSLEGKQWGIRNRLSFRNPLHGVAPAFAIVPIERDGAWDTVDVAGEGVGPNFRLSIVLKPNGPIEAWNVLPGGNYSVFESKELFRELLMWRDGQVRPLVPFQDE